MNFPPRSFSFSELGRNLIKNASGAFLLKVGERALNLLLAIVLARTMTAGSFGAYSFCLSLVEMLIILPMLGSSQLMVREIPAYRAKSQISYLKGLIRSVYTGSLIISILLMLLLAAVGALFLAGTPYLKPLLASLPLILLLSTIQVHNSTLRGLGRIMAGLTANSLRPLMILAAIGISHMSFSPAITPSYAVIMHTAAAALLAIGFGILVSLQIKNVSGSASARYDTRRWIGSALPFVFIAVSRMMIQQISVIFLGVFQNPEQVAFFRIAHRASMLISFGLIAANLTIAPVSSRLFVEGNKARLQSIVSKSVLAVAFFSFPVGFVLIFTGKWLIPFVFGAEYINAYPMVVILCLAQLINTSTGFAGLLLNMAGFEKLTTRKVAIAAVVGIVMNLVLVPALGGVGAAIATGVSLTVSNVLLVTCLYRKTGILSILWFGKNSRV
jgi:O-antigen/teichoic acid export membrane protein